MLEIVLNKISKNYGNKKILKNINFEIKTNEKVALIGQNGCGKTTIFKLILKEETPTSGNVFINKDSKINITISNGKKINSNIVIIVFLLIISVITSLMINFEDIFLHFCI